MRNSISKAIVAGLAALAMAAAVILPATPASAGWGGGSFHGGGFGGGGWHGGGGFGGGGWHGGGWGGGWRGGGWNGGWGGWRGAGWNGGWRGGGWGWLRGRLGLRPAGGARAFASGVALGAIGTSPYWDGGYGYGSGYGYGNGNGNGCWAFHATYSRSGRFLRPALGEPLPVGHRSLQRSSPTPLRFDDFSGAINFLRGAVFHLELRSGIITHG